MRVLVGTVDELKVEGRVVVKAGTHGVCVFWHDGRAYALDDRCPHMGFPLHRGTVEEGLVTCHWHHARFDLATGGTLDPFADDGRTFPVEIEGDDVYVVVGPVDARVDHHRRRLAEGLESGLTLVTAKAVLALLEAGRPPSEIVRVGLEFGVANRADGWGVGPDRAGGDGKPASPARPDRPPGGSRPRPGLRGPRHPQPPAPVPPGAPRARCRRRHLPNGSPPGTAGSSRPGPPMPPSGRSSPPSTPALPPATVATMMLAAATDHVFLDVGHTLDFTNKAFEALEHLGWEQAAPVLPTLVRRPRGRRGPRRAAGGATRTTWPRWCGRPTSGCRRCWPRGGDVPAGSRSPT